MRGVVSPTYVVSGFSRTIVTAVVILGAAVAAQIRTPLPGDPLPGVTPVEFEEFRLGLDDFLEVETAEEGLGPAFNGTSCAVCHSVPAVGGTGSIAEVRAAKRGSRGRAAGPGARGRGCARGLRRAGGTGSCAGATATCIWATSPFSTGGRRHSRS